MKLRNKIITAISAIVLIGGLVMGGILVQIVEHALNKQIEDKGQSLVKLAAEDIANPLLNGDVLTVQRMLEALVATGGGIEYAYVTSAQDMTIIHTFQNGFPSGLVNSNPVTHSMNYTAKILPTDKGAIRDIGIKVIDGLESELHIGFSQQDVLSSVKDIMRTVVSVTFGGIVLGVLAALFVSSRITSPLAKLTYHVSRLGADDLNEIQWNKGKDEISELAACFNRMTTRLRETISHIRSSEENYRMLIEAASDAGEGIVLLDISQGKPAATICYVNEEYERLTGYTRRELIGMLYTRIIPEETVKHILDSNLDDIKCCSFPRRFEIVFSHKNGETLHLETSVAETEYQGKRALIFFNRDITEKKRLDTMRDQLIGKVIIAQEEERKRIARELHDETSQSIAALVVGLKTVHTMLQSKDDGIEEVLDDIKSGANTALKELHHIIYDLRPSLLDDLGLIPALRWYVDAKLGAHNIEAFLEVTGTITRLSAEAEIAIFRIIQESITNILKYSQATQARIHLDYGKSVLGFSIEDNGCGFHFEEVLSNPKQRGLGLIGMRERAELFGGELRVDSQIGCGTKIIAEIPIRAGDNSDQS